MGVQLVISVERPNNWLSYFKATGVQRSSAPHLDMSVGKEGRVGAKQNSQFALSLSVL